MPDTNSEKQEELFNPYVGGDAEDDFEVDLQARGDFIADDATSDEETAQVAQESAEETTEETSEENTEESNDSEGEGEEEAESSAQEEPPQEDQTEEEQAEEGSEETEEPQQRKNSNFVPLSRLEAKNRKIAALERQLEESRAATQQPQQQTDAPNSQEQMEALQAKRQRVLELTIDGKTAEAAQLQTEVDAEIYQMARAEAKTQMEGEFSRQSEENRFKAAVAELEETYDFLDSTSDNFDRVLTADVTALRDVYIQRGFSPADALTEAAEKILKIERPELFVTAENDSSADEVPKKPEPKPKQPARAPAVEKNIRSAAAQPPRSQGESTRTEQAAPLNIFELSEDDFDRLSEKDLAKLRGDVVA